MCYRNIVKKEKIYEASKLYFREALTQAKSQEDIDRLGKDWRNWRLNTAKILLIWRGVHQQYLEQKWKVKKNETNK